MKRHTFKNGFQSGDIETGPVPHCVGCACRLRCDTAASLLRVFIHTADVSATVLLLPALSFYFEFAFDNGRQYKISLVSSIVEKYRPES